MRADWQDESESAAHGLELRHAAHSGDGMSRIEPHCLTEGSFGGVELAGFQDGHPQPKVGPR